MATDTSAAVRAETETPAQPIGAPEFIIRLAEDLKSKSGSDLPLSCFIEQVKMRLTGESPLDIGDASANDGRRAGKWDYHSSDCFKAWAMPE